MVCFCKVFWSKADLWQTKLHLFQINLADLCLSGFITLVDVTFKLGNGIPSWTGLSSKEFLIQMSSNEQWSSHLTWLKMSKWRISFSYFLLADLDSQWQTFDRLFIKGSIKMVCRQTFSPYGCTVFATTTKKELSETQFLKKSLIHSGTFRR